MMVKFFNRGRGSGDSPVNYLLGKNRDRENAQVLQGDPNLTAEIINSSEFSKRYTAGVLSFEELEGDITEDTKKIIMANFEKTLMCGLAPDQYNILWVEHTDKGAIETKNADGEVISKINGRLELNFIIPTTELRTGRRLQPYFHNADLMRVNAFQSITNYEFDFTDPHDPMKARTMNPFHSRDATIEDIAGKKVTEQKAIIDDAMVAKMDKNEIKDAKGVIEALENLGCTDITPREKWISVKLPDKKSATRLKGIFYNKGFIADAPTIKAYREKRKEEYDENRDADYEDQLKIWRHGVDLKRTENSNRFNVEKHFDFSRKKHNLTGNVNWDYVPYELPTPLDMALSEKFDKLNEALPTLDDALVKPADARQPTPTPKPQPNYPSPRM